MNGNFKVRCVKDYKNMHGEIAWKKGKVYEYINGVCIRDDGISSVRYDNLNEVLRSNPRYRGCLVEYVDNPTIVIHCKENKVIATMKQGKKVLKNEKAICNPSDKFDFAIGAKLAFKRLLGEDVEEATVPAYREVSRMAKVGEFVRVVDATDYPYDEYKNGDILQIVKVGRRGAYYRDEKAKFLFQREYVVLENDIPAEEAKIDLTKISDSDLIAEVQRRMTRETETITEKN